MTILRHLVITGRVQGVGYRDALCEQAKHRAVSGWVRNRSDGSVEAILQGNEADVASLIAWARHGPALAQVAEVKVGPPSEPWDRVYTCFERWPSA